MWGMATAYRGALPVCPTCAQVWWVFGELFKKGLIYRGFRVMPFSTALATPLSNFEANQAFDVCSDPWVIVNFPVIGEENTFFLAWTTTPW